MRYSIDIIMDASKQAHKEALETLATHHTINDLMVYVKDMGNELELFLKRSIYVNIDVKILNNNGLKFPRSHG